MANNSNKNPFYLGNQKLPNKNWQGEYTKAQINALKKAQRNLLYFAQTFFFIIDPDKGKGIIKLFKFQKRALRMLRDNRFNILLASRQIGKTTLLTIYALWVAMFNDYQNIVIVANKEATAIEIFRRVRLAYEEMPNWAKCGVREYGKTSCEFENGSRISISTTTGSAARGQAINCVTGESEITVKDKDTGEVKSISMYDLFRECAGEEVLDFNLIEES
jgi:hypothetical protein